MVFKGKNIHLVGVGGSGMFPLALLLCAAGARVRGIDRAISDEKHAALVEAGAQVLVDKGNSPAHDLTPPEDWLCIASPAIPDHHPDLRAARRLGIQVLHRADALAALLANRETICVAGSHGKSTTTAMLAWVFVTVAGADIGYMIGADLDDTLPARLGADSAAFLMEACEAYGALSTWAPGHAILTNVDDEHVEQYGCNKALDAAFAAFLARVPTGGALVVDGDNARALGLARRTGRKVVTCGFAPDNHLRAVRQGDGFHLMRDRTPLGVLRLAVAGRHNIQNALLVLGMALEFGVGAEQALAALATFPGINRRLQVVSNAQQPRIVDDFAHHPAEVATALQTLRADTPGRLIAVMEPQLHSRVHRLAEAFVTALAPADRCFILPVAPLGETTRQGCGNRALSDAFARAERPFDAVTDPDDLLERLAGLVAAPDTVVVMGGHTISGFAQRLAARLAAPQRPHAAGTSVLFGPRTPLAPDLLAVVADHLRRNPDAPAVEMGHRRLSYRELWQRAGALETRLRRAGVGAGDVVGVYLRPNVDRVSAFLATLRLGAVYLPLDPALPEQRLAQMLADAAARAVIVNAASPALPDSAPAFVSSDLLDDEATIDFDALRTHAPTQLAYLIYTSGTTGTPKGVGVSRGAIANYATAACAPFSLTAKSRMSLVSAFGFDVNIGDMAIALAAGACLVLPTEIEGRPGASMGQFIARKRLSHLSLTPSALGVVPSADYPDLTTIIVAGEPCPPTLVKRWLGGRRTFINAYGPTEATVEATFAYCDGSEPVSLGRPFDNMGLCILNDALEAVEIGTEGELCLFGAGLAAGYRNQPELSEEKFPTLPAPPWGPGQGGLRIYRTGDRAVIGADGALVYRGRMDDQFKILGHRVDPSEIEAALCALPDVQDCAVTMVNRSDAQGRLAAHLVLHPGVLSLDVPTVRAALAQRLPRYMQPSILLPVTRIPRTPNGKRDRSALAIPPLAFMSHSAKAPGTATEKRILALLAEVLPGLQVEGIRDNLPDAGMDSLDLVNLLSAIEAAFGISLDIAFPPGSETVEFLALAVDAQLKAPSIASSTGALRISLADIVLPHLATWPGQPATERGLLRHIPENTGSTRLYWIFQTGKELAALNTALAPAGITVFGTRSGHLLYEYSEANLAALTTLLADEIESLHNDGPIHVGGNCQGGTIMLRVAKELIRRGQAVDTILLMEQGRFPVHHGPVVLMFGEGSYLNPYALIENPDAVFRAAYPLGYHVEIITGQHGQYFDPHNIASLASAVTHHIHARRPASQSLEPSHPQS